MTVYAITDTKKREQGLRLLIFKLPQINFVIILGQEGRTRKIPTLNTALVAGASTHHSRFIQMVLTYTAISFIIQVFDLSCGRLSQQCVCDDEHGGHGDSGRLLTNQPTNTEPADVTANRKKMVHGHANKKRLQPAHTQRRFRQQNLRLKTSLSTVCCTEYCFVLFYCRKTTQHQ